MEQDDIDRYDDGAIYPELTEEEQLALEDREFPTQPKLTDIVCDGMKGIATESEKLMNTLGGLQDLLSK